MSYVDQKMSGGKIGAIVIVVLLHVALGYAFITGLAYQYIQKAKKEMNTFDVQEPPPPPPDVPPPPPPPPAPPAPPAVSKAAGLKGNPAQFFGPDAYPPAAIRAEAQGRVVARLSVGTDGRVSDCSVTTSSGNADLDSATCRIAKARVRFSPAQDASGAAIASGYTLPVRWVLPKE